MTRITGTGATHPGRERDANEDSWIADDTLGLYVVCDGMGGHQAGEVASRLAIDLVVETVRDRRSQLNKQDHGAWDTSALLATAEEAVAHACRVIHRIASENADKAGMGCTLTMLLVSGAKAVMGHVGDTRLYLLRDGAAHQLSTDHTMAAEYARMGVIRPEDVPSHPFAHVLTRAIGSQAAVKVDTLVLDLVPKDRLVICSDGLSDYLAGDELIRIAQPSESGAAVARALIDFANEAGGKDNITVVTVEVPDSAAESTAAHRGQHIRHQILALAAAPLFDEDFLGQLLRLVEAADLRQLTKGDVLVEAAQQTAALYVPVDGTLRVAASDGRTREVTRGEVLGETTLFHPRPARATVRAATDCHVLILDADGMRDLIRQHPFFGVGVLERLGAHLSRQLDQFQRSSSKDLVL